MGLFGDLDVRLDPWDVEYGSELPLQAPGEAPAEDVDLGVEVPAGTWRPLEPGPAAAPRRLVFVDGVRRVEARLIVRRAESVAHGAFGSLAVGAVVSENGAARFGEARARRLVVFGATESTGSLPPRVHVSRALEYETAVVASPDVDAPLLAIQDEMRRAEERLVAELAGEDGGAGDTVVIADGPLTFPGARGLAVGYIKRLHRLYLPASGLALLASLPPCWRTPLFAVRATNRFARFAWFVRLDRAAPAESDLAGIARLEVSETVGVDAARRIADLTAAVLPRYAPGRGRDPRSPQNLLPIGALEAALRRRLGDVLLVRRHLAALLARETAHAAAA